MLIKSLEQMETIVDNNESLSWDGWTVLEAKKSPTAWMEPNAKFIKHEWHTVNRFDITESGWDIPAKLVKKNGE
jgi:hypothetical protein